MNSLTYVHGELPLLWWEEEVNNMIIQEHMQHAIIGKLLYGWPELEKLHQIITLQYEIRGECHIGLPRNHFVLIRFIDPRRSCAFALKNYFLS